MFVFLAFFIIFLLVLNIFIHKDGSAQKKTEEDFCKREQEANFTRRKDISNLGYLTIPLEKIPQTLHTEAEKKLVSLSSCQMLNLTGKTNTDLKLEYGVANLDTLMECDNNFTEFVKAVSVYAGELIEANQQEEAQTLLELAVSYHADSTTIFTLLADLYQQKGQTNQIQSLIDIAQELNSLTKPIIIEKLQAYLT